MSGGEEGTAEGGGAGVPREPVRYSAECLLSGFCVQGGWEEEVLAGAVGSGAVEVRAGTAGGGRVVVQQSESGGRHDVHRGV